MRTASIDVEDGRTLPGMEAARHAASVDGSRSSSLAASLGRSPSPEGGVEQNAVMVQQLQAGMAMASTVASQAPWLMVGVGVLVSHLLCFCLSVRACTSVWSLPCILPFSFFPPAISTCSWLVGWLPGWPAGWIADKLDPNFTLCAWFCCQLFLFNKQSGCILTCCCDRCLFKHWL